MKVVTFGELMVRLQPFNYERFVQANSLEFSFGGGEANVAVSLANYGLDAALLCAPNRQDGARRKNGQRHHHVLRRPPGTDAFTACKAFKGED